MGSGMKNVGKVIPYHITPPHATAFTLQQGGAMMIQFSLDKGEEVAKCFEEHARALRDIVRIGKEQEAKQAAKAPAIPAQVPTTSAPTAPVAPTTPQGQTLGVVLQERDSLRKSLIQSQGEVAELQKKLDAALAEKEIDSSEAVTPTVEVETSGETVEPTPEPQPLPAVVRDLDELAAEAADRVRNGQAPS